MQTHFSSDVLVVVESLDLRVPIRAFNKSGRHLEFLIHDLIRGKTSAAIVEFDSLDSTMSGREAKSGHYNSLYSILFLNKH